MRCEIAEFVRRLAPHVQDQYPHTIRYFGLLAPRTRVSRRPLFSPCSGNDSLLVLNAGVGGTLYGSILGQIRSSIVAGRQCVWSDVGDSFWDRLFPNLRLRRRPDIRSPTIHCALVPTVKSWPISLTGNAHKDSSELSIPFQQNCSSLSRQCPQARKRRGRLVKG